MPEAEAPRHLRPALEALLALFKDAGVPGIVVGGLAVGVHAQPRTTQDVDALILFDMAELDGFLETAAKHGLEYRRPDGPVLARQNRVLVLRHVPSGVPIDIALGCMPFDEEAVNNAVRRDIAGVSTPIPTPDDLVIMKAVAHRPIDGGDIDMLLTVHPPADLRRIRRWVKQYADLLHDPEIVTDLEKVLKRHKGARRSKPKGA